MYGRDLTEKDRKWWKEAVVYQVYPRSFYDSNNDGIGDIKGIIEKLDYIRELGADVIWLCPVYQSPNCDNGYDISDYYSIMGEFGTLADFDRLLAQAHEKGLRIVMDLVVNHTSDQHKWFVESRASRENDKRDYYIWREGKDGKEPNNWSSYFCPSAWEYDETTGEYYLHLFAKHQPDLNWENQSMREEIYKMMIWWLDRGIDGFRMDTINTISKVPGLPSVPAQDDGYHPGTQFFKNGPKIHEYLQEMNRRVLSGHDILTVGETSNVTPETALDYVGYDRKELDMLFQFEHMSIDAQDGDKWKVKKWKLSELKRITGSWQKSLHGKGWQSIYWGNHDQPRAVSRFGDDGRYRVESAKLLAIFLFTLEGTPYVYQGDEIGMTNVKFPSIKDYCDIETFNYYDHAEGTAEEKMEAIHKISRDNARTPMQWNDGKNAGFSQAEPWIAVNPNYQEINVEKEQKTADSILAFYRQIISLRKNTLALIYGEYISFDDSDEDVYCYERRLADESVFVIMNFTDRKLSRPLPEAVAARLDAVLLANYKEGSAPSDGVLELQPFEARIYRLK